MNVKGPNKHELYKWFAAQKEHLNAEPTWNFAKFLLRENQPYKYFDCRVPPNDMRETIAKINATL